MLWNTSSVPPVEVEQFRKGPANESNTASDSEAADDDNDEDGAGGGTVVSGTGKKTPWKWR